MILTNILMIKHQNSQQNNSSSKQSQYYDWAHPNTQIKPAFKYATPIIMLSLLFLYRIFWLQTLNSSCLTDKLHQITSFINRSLSSHGKFWVIGLIQILIDSSVCFIMFYWVWKIPNSRMPTSVALTFALRSMFIATDKLPFPENFLWESPGFPSLFVPYGRTRDFYFSGHTTTTFLIFMELTHIKAHNILTIWSGINFLIVVFTLIMLEVHYTIDCIGGIIFSGLIYLFVNKFLQFFDGLWGLPFQIVKKLVIKCKKNKMQEGQDFIGEDIDDYFYSYTEEKDVDEQKKSNKSDYKSQLY